MKLRERPLMWSVLVTISAAVIGPALASAQPMPWTYPPSVVPGFDVTLYEATEIMSMIKGKVVRRQATSALIGVVAPGTPLCPGTTTCTLVANGSDDISMATGVGTVNGIFDLVVQDDNQVDSPEQVVVSGKFSGNMDFSPAILNGIPYGTISGQMQPYHGKKIPFTGMFLLPVDPPVFNMACLATNPNLSACVTGWGPPSYLTNPSVFPLGFTPVNPNEFAFGYPMVRFQIKF